MGHAAANGGNGWKAAVSVASAWGASWFVGTF